MTLPTRRRLFYSLLAAFFALGTVVLLYASGWRLDFSGLKLRKVGAIYVRSFPDNAAIFLDGKSAKNESGLLQKGTLIGNLFPKTYELKLTAGGFRDWRENISVEPSLVTEEAAVLVPENISAAATGTIADFRLANGSILLRDADGFIRTNDEKIGAGEIAGWTDDLSFLLSQDGAAGSYFWNDIRQGTKTDLGRILKKYGIASGDQFDIFPDPKDSKALFVLEPAKISKLDFEKRSLTKIYKAAAGTVLENLAVSQFFLAWSGFNKTTDTSTIFVYDKFLEKFFTREPVLEGKNTNLAWLGNGRLAILQDNGALYSYDPDGGNVQKIADDAKSFSFVSDGSAAAALENRALEVFFFGGENNYYKFRLPEIQSAEKAVWYRDLSHLFIIYPDKVRFLDLKDYSLNNFQTVAETSRAEYDEKNNRLYFLDSNGLEKLDFPM